MEFYDKTVQELQSASGLWKFTQRLEVEVVNQ